VLSRAGAGTSGAGASKTSRLRLVTGPSSQSSCARSGVRLAVCSEEVCVLAEDHEVEDIEASSEEDLDELLVEEVSIDGMCGVY
jgi:mycofactocin precursor